MGNTVSEQKVELRECSLCELFGGNGNLGNYELEIPIYQRSYEWKTFHVKELLNDTYEAFAQKDNKEYLMGTIILHENNSDEDNINYKYDVIDGQQRLLTLNILLYCLEEGDDDIYRSLLETKYSDVKSKYYIKNTQKEVNSFLHTITEEQKQEYKENLLKKLKFNVLTVSGDNALDLAYSFFDSQNSKGKELTDFNLLKAYHLMFIPGDQESLAKKHNDYWEDKNDMHEEIFGSILRRIRMWNRGVDRDSNEDRKDFHEFISDVEPKYIEKEEHFFNRYLQPVVYRSWYRENDEIVLNMKYPHPQPKDLLPMKITQTIEGGDPFFLYAEKYHELYNYLFENSKNEKPSSIKFIHDLSNAMKNNYLSMAFKAVILLYYDKFGERRVIDVATCVELIISKIRFEWADVRPRPVTFKSTLSLVNEKSLIPIIMNSTIPSHVIAQMINEIDTKERFEFNKESKKLSPTLKDYKNSIKNFYKNRKSKIENGEILRCLNRAYMDYK